MLSLFLRAQPKLPQRPLRLPGVVAAHERHQSTLIMEAMTNRVVYAQTTEGYTPAWSELVSVHSGTRHRGVWSDFVSTVRSLMSRALSGLRGSGHSRTITYPGSSKRGSLPHYVKRGSPPHYAKRSSLPNNGSSDSSLDSRGEDLIRRALEDNGPRRVRFYEGNPVWLYDEEQPVRVYDGSQPEIDSSPIGRHQNVAELSPRSVVAAGWTAAARGAHSRAGSITPPEVAHVY
ncbi:unnamed protein product [Rhizoctonia solani]|uniref:Uncharacterized protein n=1 Tax=Rhizoctonia solani TaxID=456999 RepID=A0A8H3D4J7_9AGAM|nr:unnamed protein product [Rhizoctonia solani]